MPVVPDRIAEQIIFSEQHAARWALDPGSIGLSPLQVEKVAQAAALAAGRHREALAARQAARAATVAMHAALRGMRELVAEAVKGVRLYAETTGDPNVFARAEFAPPAAPTPTPAPSRPVQLGAILGVTGSVSVRWKPGPATPGTTSDTTGVLYTISRRLDGERGFTMIGTAGTNRAGRRGFKSFTDHEVPAGMPSVRYTVQARRGGAGTAGPVSEVLTVSLGSIAGPEGRAGKSAA